MDDSQSQEVDYDEIDLSESQGEVIDLNDEPVVEALPRHVKKSVTRLVALFPFHTRNEIIKVVKGFCKLHPADTDIDNIVEECTQTFESKQPEPEVTLLQRKDSVKLSPLQEVLKVLPQAKATYVEGLLAKYNNGVNEVVQDMLEKGYEKEEAKPSSSSTSKTPELDFISTSWTTTAPYRANALVELENNFPYLRVTSLTKIFETHKFHYYPTYKTLLDATGNAATYHSGSSALQTYYSPLMVAELRGKCAEYKEVPLVRICWLAYGLHETVYPPIPIPLIGRRMVEQLGLFVIEAC